MNSTTSQSNLSSVWSLETLTTIATTLATAPQSQLMCIHPAVPCDKNSKNCNPPRGICCVSGGSAPFCRCNANYEAPDCFKRADSTQASRTVMRWIGMSTGISIVVGIIALLALGTIIYLVVSSSRRRRPWFLSQVESDKDLDTTISFIQEEVSKLPTLPKLAKLHRLSKMFEKTVREAILSGPGEHQPRPTSTSMNAFLPRWSSAPNCANPSQNDTVFPDGLQRNHERIQRKQIFSLQQPMQYGVVTHI